MIRSLLFKNLGLKILSLCFAVVLWYSVVSERQTNLLVTVPLTFVNVPRTMRVRSVSAERVSLHLEGPVSSMKTMEIGKIRGTIDLTGVHEGKSRFELFPGHFNLPEGIRVVSISPEVVYVKLEKLLTFKLSIKPRLKGRVDSHYAIKKVYTIPGYVWVRGDRKALSSIDNIPTDVITVDGLKEDLKKVVTLEVPRDVHLKENVGGVEVHVELRKKIWDKGIDEVKVKLDHPFVVYLYRIEPEYVKVYVRGWAAVVDSISASDIEAVVSVKGLGKGEHWVRPSIKVHKGLKVLSVIPDKIKLVVERRMRE